MDKVLNKIRKSSFKDRIILTGYVSEEEKAGLYKNAEAFLFPSQYEGFGIPVLESFSYGVPVITAKNSSLPEVGGNAAIYIENVMSSAELEECMKKIFGLSEADRMLLSEKGIQQFNKFTWKKCAREIFELLRKCGLIRKGIQKVGICSAKSFSGTFDRIEYRGAFIMTETATLTWFSGNYGSTMQAFALQKR